MVVIFCVFCVFGLIIGSFLNVLILRHGARPLSGRSGCMSCGKAIAWHDLIPVYSWLALRGKCRHCGSRISAQYPLVEAATGLLFGTIGVALWPAIEISPIQHILLLADYFVVAAFLIAIAVYDLRHTIIPDSWAYSFAAFALISQLLTMAGSTNVLAVLLAGPLAAAPLFFLWFISGGRWMGLGDPKLALGIGWLLGIHDGLLAVFGAFVIGAVVSVPLLLLSTQWWKNMQERFSPMGASHMQRMGFTIKSEVPFGPFLIVATVVLWLLSLYGVQLTLFS